MSYAKIKDTDVIKFPYTLDDLLQENPNTNYDDRFELDGWYAQTEEAIDTGNSVVKVSVGEPPHLEDYRTHIAALAETPTLKDGVWVLEYVIRARTKTELDAYDEMVANDPQK